MYSIHTKIMQVLKDSYKGKISISNIVKYSYKNNFLMFLEMFESLQFFRINILLHLLYDVETDSRVKALRFKMKRIWIIKQCL